MSQIGELPGLATQFSTNDNRVERCVTRRGALHEVIPVDLWKRGFIDRQRLFDAEDVKCSDIPTVRRILERRPGVGGWSLSEFVPSIEQKADPLGPKVSNRVHELRRFIIRTIELACLALLMVHVTPPPLRANARTTT